LNKYLRQFLQRVQYLTGCPSVLPCCEFNQTFVMPKSFKNSRGPYDA
jgi:hypothetical protein